MESENYNLEVQPTENASRTFGFWFALGVGLLVVTQLVRTWVLSSDLPTFLNDRFAFSIDFPIAVMYLLYLVAMFFIGRYLIKHWYELGVVAKFGFVLIIAGGVSNLLERVFTGHAVDYIYIANGVLNLADFYILIGIVLIFIDRKHDQS
jgi:lipoprotein signal peptidase